MPRFAANLGYLFTDRPLLQRIDAAAGCGFKAIELQFPYDAPASEVKAAIARNRLTMLGVNTLPDARVSSGWQPFPAANRTGRRSSPARSITLPPSAAAPSIVSPA